MNDQDPTNRYNMQHRVNVLWSERQEEIATLRQQLDQKQADLDRALARVAELEASSLKLPHDVVINGGMTFRKGVALKTFIRAAERWHKQAMHQYKSIDADELKQITGMPKENTHD